MKLKLLQAALLCFLLLAGGTAIAQLPARSTPGPSIAAVADIDREHAAAQPASTSSPWLIPFISAAAGVFGALIGGYFGTRNAKAAIIQKTNELEIAAIDYRISEFIAPFEQLSIENLKLSRELKRSHGGEIFRTLPALLDPDWKKGLSAGDRALVDAIVENGKILREMILTHGGAVSTAIRPHLAAASMHFRMLSLADAGSLENDAKRYEAYVYPRQLDGALTLERSRLETRREKLRSQPAVGHGPIEDLKIPHDLAVTVS